MKKQCVWMVMVTCGQGKHRTRTLRTIPTDVRDAANAVPQATQRNPGRGYDWYNAEVLRVKR
jgi:hypothetical protein